MIGSVTGGVLTVLFWTVILGFGGVAVVSWIREWWEDRTWRQFVRYSERYLEQVEQRQQLEELWNSPCADDEQ